MRAFKYIVRGSGSNFFPPLRGEKTFLPKSSVIVCAGKRLGPSFGLAIRFTFLQLSGSDSRVGRPAVGRLLRVLVLERGAPCASAQTHSAAPQFSYPGLGPEPPKRRPPLWSKTCPPPKRPCGSLWPTRPPHRITEPTRKKTCRDDDAAASRCPDIVS